MDIISTETIEKAVYELCFKACTCLDDRIYSQILFAYEKSEDEYSKNLLKAILTNAKIAYDKKMPLCQDTGRVIVFVEIGQNVIVKGDLIEDAINSGVAKCYKENFFRKSTVKNAVFDRSNTGDNTPAIIYTKQIPGNKVKINVLIKGAGSENKSRLEMMLPVSSEEEIIEKCSEMILFAGENSCPPMFTGIGIGGTADKAFLLSKYAFVSDEFSDSENDLANKILKRVNSSKTRLKGNYVQNVKVKTCASHIASLAVALTVNCHSDRVSGCIISENHIEYLHKIPEFRDFDDERSLKEINAADIDSLKKLKEGEEFFLSGEIYIARDAAHKRMSEMIKNGETLPFDLNDKIIFYAGPCPAKKDEIIGSVGPTTSSRLDKYLKEFYAAGLFATVGKGDRSPDAVRVIKNSGGKYFKAQGGIAALTAQKIKSCELIAFEDLGPEAIYKIYAEKLPLETCV